MFCHEFRFLFDLHATFGLLPATFFRKKCNHAPELRTFKLLNATTTFEKLESQFLCQPDAVFEISLSKNEEGPWTKLDDDSTGGVDLYQAPIGAIVQQVKYLAMTWCSRYM